MRHKLIERQIRRHLKKTLELQDPVVREELERLFAAISQAYFDSDADRVLIERSQELSSRELEASGQALVDAHAKLLGSAKMSALGEMAGGIAHEINTPLAAISMRAECLEEALKENGEIDREFALSCTQAITKTVDRISRIIKGLRLFARDQRGDPMSPVDIGLIINDTLGLCSERLHHHGVKLRLGEIPSIFVECRLVEISQVLLNLLSNSSDAIANQDEKWISIEVNEHENQIEILVTDSGSGIPPMIREKLMQPFFTTKEIGKGTGLGLSLSKGIAENHGGSLRLDESCSNTRFVLKLPKRQAGLKAA